MKNAIILHGTCDKEEYFSNQYPSGSNSHWLPWLQKQLIKHNIAAATPEVPLAFDPQYEIWKREFERYDIGPETILVGHSCCAGFMVRWLSENKAAIVGKVVLVAPWIDPHREKTTDFFDFDFDKALVGRTNGVTIFNSTNDDSDIHESVETIMNCIEGIKCQEFRDYGHFCFSDMKTTEFPELLKEIVG